MCSVPPATMVVANPAMIRSAALAIVCRPEEQKRLTVWPGTLSGSPARWAAIRATFRPWVPSVTAQPSSTSSTSAGSRPSARRRASAMAAPAMSSGRLVRRLPRGARPTAVRAPLTITASFIASFLSVADDLAGHQEALDPLHGLGLAEQGQERVALQVEDVLLAHPLAERQLAPAQHPGQVAGDHPVVLAGLAGPLEGLHAQLQGGQDGQPGRVHRRLPGG